MSGTSGGWGRSDRGTWVSEALLRLLIGRERYGIEVADQVQAAWLSETGGRDGEIPEGSIYAELRRLEHRGLLVGQWVDVGERRPRRRYYALSPNGQRVAEARRIARPDGSPAITGLRP